MRQWCRVPDIEPLTKEVLRIYPNKHKPIGSNFDHPTEWYDQLKHTFGACLHKPVDPNDNQLVRWL